MRLEMLLTPLTSCSTISRRSWSELRKAAVEVHERQSDSGCDRRNEFRHGAAGSRNHQYRIGRGRTDGLDETSFQQRGSQRRSGAPRARRRRAGKPRCARHPRRDAAHPSSVQATARKIKSLGDRSWKSPKSSMSSTTSPSKPICWRSTPPSKPRAPEKPDADLPLSPMRSATCRALPHGDQRYFRANQSHPIRDQRSRRRHGRRHQRGRSRRGLADQAGKALEAISSVVRQSAELVQEISLASKQQVRGTEGVANAMQIISGITRRLRRARVRRLGRLATW